LRAARHSSRRGDLRLSRGASIGAATISSRVGDLARARVGTRDYARKCGFSRVVLGLSGGIDSALTAAIAAEALGRQTCSACSCRRRFRAAAASDDSLALARNIGIETLTLPIDRPWRDGGMLRDAFAGTSRDVTEENIQARIRGNLLMALSNKRGALLLTTGNKSELAVGYCTLYGDMSGGLGVIADVPKTMVYRVARVAERREGGRSSRKPSDQGAVGGAPAEPDRSGFTAAVRRARRDPRSGTSNATSRPGHRRRRIRCATVHRVLRLVRGAEFKRKQAARA
jgi:NAD+ synthase/NAD+ synthase (glutamine-hydrolysing)